jgi:hypothetical protein
MNVNERMELAQRIARHQAPAQVKVDPDEARIELIRLAARKLLAARIDTDNREFLRQVGITDPTDLE